MHTDGVADAASLIAEQVDDETTAVCITHVAPFTGRRHDLRGARRRLPRARRAADGGRRPDHRRRAHRRRRRGRRHAGHDRHEVAARPARRSATCTSRPRCCARRRCSTSATSASTRRSATGRWTSCRAILPDGRRYELGLPSLPALAALHGGHRAAARRRHRQRSSPSPSGSSRGRWRASSASAARHPDADGSGAAGGRDRPAQRRSRGGVRALPPRRCRHRHDDRRPPHRSARRTTTTTTSTGCSPASDALGVRRRARGCGLARWPARREHDTIPCPGAASGSARAAPSRA